MEVHFGYVGIFYGQLKVGGGGGVGGGGIFVWVGWVDIYGWMEMGRVSGGIFLIFCVGGHFLWKSEGGWGNEVYFGWGGVFT